jgi:hypothetical protein
VEIAFEMRKGEEFLGWLLFQMDMDRVKNEFFVDEKALKKLQFQKL